MLTRHISVSRTAPYHILGDPDGAWDEIWYVLHGYGQRAAGFLEQCTALEAPRRLVVAPEGLSRFYTRGTRGDVGASWMTREEREGEVADYVAYLDAVHCELRSARPERGKVPVGILGFSQGTATASRWTVLGKIRPNRLVLWASGFPPDLDPDATREALADVRVELVLGDVDPVVPAARGAEEAERLRALAPKFEVHRFPGGHELDADLVVKVTTL